MTRKLVGCWWTAALVGLLAGCAGSDKAAGGGKDEEQAREAFTAFQKALAAKDGDKLWSMLDEDAQADVERAAKAAREAYAKADPDERAKQEKALGLSGKELESLKGPVYLRSKRFLGKYDEVPESKVEQVTVQGDKATVNYTEPDGDKEKHPLLRQGGQWKVTLPKGA
jgi:hypothetical protein